MMTSEVTEDDYWTLDVSGVDPEMLNASAVEILETETVPKNKVERKLKRDKRRSDLPTRDEFIAFLNARSPPRNRSPLPVYSEEFSVLPVEDSSSDEEVDWASLRSTSINIIDESRRKKMGIKIGTSKIKSESQIQRGKPINRVGKKVQSDNETKGKRKRSQSPIIPNKKSRIVAAMDNGIEAFNLKISNIETPQKDNLNLSLTGGGLVEEVSGTPPPLILDGVVVWVEYRLDGANTSSAIQSLATQLGARVEPRLSKRVTHVLFKDGSQAMFRKAKKWGLPILSARWLEECKKVGHRVSEADYPSVSYERYATPGLFPKIKVIRSMQPRTLEEDFENASKRFDRRQKIMEKKKTEIDLHSINSQSPIIIDKILNGVKDAKESPVMKALARFTTPTGTPQKLSLRSDLTPSPTSPSEKDLDTPLAERLAKRFQSTPATPNSTPSRRSNCFSRRPPNVAR